MSYVMGNNVVAKLVLVFGANSETIKLPQKLWSYEIAGMNFVFESRESKSHYKVLLGVALKLLS